MRVITLRNLKVCLFQWVFLFSLLSCSQESALVVDQARTQEKEFQPVEHDFVELVNSDDSIVYEVRNLGTAPVKLILLLKSEGSVLSVANKRSEFQLNYFYDSDIETGLKQIKLFEARKANETLMMFPVTTEEFPTFSLVQFDNRGKFTYLGTHTYSFDDFEKVAEQIPKGNYALRTIDDTIRVVLQSTPELILSEVWFDEGEHEEALAESEIQKIKTFDSTGKVVDYNKNNIVKFYVADLDGDNLDDKISILRNEGAEYEFDSEYFNLPIEIFKRTKNGWVEWTKNENIIFPAVGSCVSEGFDGLEVVDGQLKIYQQSCRDYNILIQATTIFEVKDGKLWLVEYSETYFNKANHDEEIPTRKWTSSDFGTVKFEDINPEFWRTLRGY